MESWQKRRVRRCRPRVIGSGPLWPARPALPRNNFNMHAALIIVDVQNDFCAGGPLAVPDAEAILPVLNELIADFQRVFLTQDWHPPGHVSFASRHPGHALHGRISLPSGPQILWPDHCIAGTSGAAFHPKLKIPAAATVVRKGIHRHVDSYSAFFENDRQTPVGLDAALRAAGVDSLVLAGLATDYCVLHTALDARSLNYDVTVVESGCRGIDLEGSVADAWLQMARAGVRRE
jgi:nicotinamidase-related amidase